MKPRLVDPAIVAPLVAPDSVVATSTITDGAITNRVVVHRIKRSHKTQRELGYRAPRITSSKRTATVVLGISMDIVDLEAIDLRARAAKLSRSEYLVACALGRL